MIRILFFIAVIGIVFFFGNLIMNLISSNECDYCNGKGYWRETRGEKNKCKVCNGTGNKLN